MAWVFSAEVGASDANSYLTTSDATDLLAPCFNANAWTDATTPNKEKALAQASRDIDAGHRFRGTKYYGTLQALEWPRTCQEEDPTTIPADIRIACAQQALWIFRTRQPAGATSARPCGPQALQNSPSATCTRDSPEDSP